MDFYHLGTHQTVSVPDDQVKKVQVASTTSTGKPRITRMFQAIAEDGQKMSKMVSKATFELLDGLVEERVKEPAR